jgi:DNA polymerase
MTRFQLHVRDWLDCTRCESHLTRKHVVLARGDLPCDVLFVGEAPGESEDVIGRPFCGPAGKLLDKIIGNSCYRGPDEPGLSIALTNLVGCIPREDGKKAGEPDHECIMTCRPRLEELIRIAQPRLIVRVGKLAKEYLDQGYKHSVKVPEGITMIDIIHPSAILRANIAQRGLLVQKAVVTLSNALEAL